VTQRKLGGEVTVVSMDIISGGKKMFDLNDVVKYVKKRRKESIEMLRVLGRYRFIKEHCIIRFALPRKMGNTSFGNNIDGIILYPTREQASAFLNGKAMRDYNNNKYDDTIIIDNASSLTEAKLNAFIKDKCCLNDLNKFVLVLVG
jgi:hypothetical protein